MYLWSFIMIKDREYSNPWLSVFILIKFTCVINKFNVYERIVHVQNLFSKTNERQYP